jgi:hypothetical protein
MFLLYGWGLVGSWEESAGGLTAVAWVWAWVSNGLQEHAAS